MIKVWHCARCESPCILSFDPEIDCPISKTPIEPDVCPYNVLPYDDDEVDNYADFKLIEIEEIELIKMLKSEKHVP